MRKLLLIDDFLFMVKLADSCLKKQPTLAFYSGGIDILFFKKEKKEYILLVTGNVYKDTFFN